MREILFRGQTTKDKEWVYGDLLHDGYDYDVAIWEKEYKLVTEVSTETIGQFTGLTDKNGKKIFEGDIVKDIFLNSRKMYEVKFTTDCNCGFEPFCEQIYDGEMLIEPQDCEVIGNIHDNPELLEVSE